MWHVRGPQLWWMISWTNWCYMQNVTTRLVECWCATLSQVSYLQITYKLEIADLENGFLCMAVEMYHCKDMIEELLIFWGARVGGRDLNSNQSFKQGNKGFQCWIWPTERWVLKCWKLSLNLASYCQALGYHQPLVNAFFNTNINQQKGQHQQVVCWH